VGRVKDAADFARQSHSGAFAEAKLACVLVETLVAELCAEFARADVRGELNVLPLLGEFRDDRRPGGLGEPADLVARVVGRPRLVRQRDADQNRLFAGDGELIPLGVECPTDMLSSSGSLVLSPSSLDWAFRSTAPGKDPEQKPRTKD
jgi:hypothetical protein